jgi:hypothetical protein
VHTLYGICDGLYTPQMSINIKFNLVYENKNKNYDECTLLIKYQEGVEVHLDVIMVDV